MAEIMTTILGLAVGEVVKNFSKEFLVPFLDGKIGKNDLCIASKIEEYLDRVSKKLSCISTIAFPNDPRNLEEIYIPPEISIDHKRSISLNSYHDAETLGNKVLIIDTAGAGKSTLFKWLFLTCIKKTEKIPVFIELRKLDRSRPIVSIICDEIKAINDQVHEHSINTLIDTGGFVFFFDGLDEIAESESSKTIAHLKEFIDRSGSNRFFISSRPGDRTRPFSDFKGYHLKGLTKDQAYELLTKYDRNGNHSSGLIKELEKSSNKTLNGFLGNPLLVSLLLVSYSHKSKIPIHKITFFSQLFDALFERHDAFKDGFDRIKNCGLEKYNFEKILRYIGFYTSAKLGTVEYTSLELHSIIERASKHTSLKFPVDKFVEDIKTSVPIFLEEGDKIKWSHKSIQDYFAACFIKFESENQVASRILCTFVTHNPAKFQVPN
jgi:predicted NACHT family NTPase